MHRKRVLALVLAALLSLGATTLLAANGRDQDNGPDALSKIQYYLDQTPQDGNEPERFACYDELMLYLSQGDFGHDHTIIICETVDLSHRRFCDGCCILLEIPDDLEMGDYVYIPIGEPIVFDCLEEFEQFALESGIEFDFDCDDCERYTCCTNFTPVITVGSERRFSRVEHRPAHGISIYECIEHVVTTRRTCAKCASIVSITTTRESGCRHQFWYIHGV
ncbi:MAG: hypothetical protein FWC93_05405 [Defluviitaleaceae bacterium]|nr:hypothetical protein [Defluviitaleaceae bacterium]